MSDLSVSEASEVTLLQELLTRKTENGHHLFKESSITNKEAVSYTHLTLPTKA